jgi:hypothetical protein
VSAENSIAQGGRSADPQTQQTEFDLPPEVVQRYETRAVEAPTGQRLGLFLPGDRQNPAIEIGNDRIVARKEDAETVEALVKIARHNGWQGIDVDGSPEFRKAVWSAATREGIAVRGYEPSFVEQERIEELRRTDAARREREATTRPNPTPLLDAGSAAIAAPNVEVAPGPASSNAEISETDRRLLLTLSRHTEDRKGLYENLRGEMDAFQREVQHERIDVNRDALNGALENALASPTLVSSFARSGYEPGDLRQMARDGAWETEVADAIYLVRSGLNRRDAAREASASIATLADEMAADREDRLVAVSIDPSPGEAAAAPTAAREGRQRDRAADRRHEDEALAELFLHGGAERTGAEPRLANALQAQAAMERHLDEVFDGDAGRMASATLDSRQMISDVLRRGLDVSVREPTPVRQIEPIHATPELER